MIRLCELSVMIFIVKDQYLSNCIVLCIYGQLWFKIYSRLFGLML